MERLNVRVKKLDKNAVVPKIATEFSAGADLYACSGGKDIEINSGETVFVHTGLAMEIPVGYVGLVYARSGLASKKGLAPANKVGVVDSDYRGEIMVAIHNHSGEKQVLADKERIAQIVLTPYLVADYEECEELSETARGSGGFGSTGNK